MSKYRFIWIGLIVLLLAVMAVIIIRDKDQGEDADPNTQPLAVPVLGVSFSPQSFNGEGILDFYAKAKMAGGLVTWVGDYKEMGNKSAGAYSVTRGLGKQGLTTVPVAVILSEHLQEPGAIESIEDAISQYAQEFEPEYLGIGNEVNSSIYERDGKLFDKFSEAFAITAQRVKEVSPDTKVFTVFQLERLKGLRGGLFGEKNNTQSHNWDLLAKLPSADFFAYTTYPGLIYQSPEEIPEDYYQEILARTNKPLAFSETGWFRSGPSAWASSEQEQAQYIDRFFSLTRELDPKFSIWSFLYDPNTKPPFDTMGLLSVDQDTSPAWTQWQSKLNK